MRSLGQENFGSLYEAFKTSLKKTELLKKRNVPKKWIGIIKEVAEKNIELKAFMFSATLSLKNYKPSGINLVKEVLQEAEKMKLSVNYISAPEYLIKFKTKDAKKGEREFSEKLEKIVLLAKKNGSEASIDFKNR